MKNIRSTIFKSILSLTAMALIVSCQHERQDDVEKYHTLVNDAELAICRYEYRTALDNYGLAFRQIKKPFGKDLYNAALAAQASGFHAERDQYLQQLINGSEEIAILKAIFLSRFMTVQEWKILESNRRRDFDSDLRNDMMEIHDSDQTFYSDYANYSDSADAMRLKYLNQLVELSEKQGFPSHIEIGYSEGLRRQPHHTVLLHTAKRRSEDKGVKDLEPLLRKAVDQGRIDPELAVQFLKYQNDKDKGHFETYSTKQYRHALLPDSVSNSLWVVDIDDADLAEVNEIRSAWYANPIEDIQVKAQYLEESSWPFLFTSVHKSVANLAEQSTSEEAVEQYLLHTDGMTRVR